MSVDFPWSIWKNNFKWFLEMKRSNTQSGLIGESREAFDIREKLGKGWWKISCQQWDATVTNGSSMSFVSTLCTINLLVINLFCKNRPHCSPKKIQTVESYWNSGRLNLFILYIKKPSVSSNVDWKTPYLVPGFPSHGALTKHVSCIPSQFDSQKNSVRSQFYPLVN
jgi:hypothetical protein